MEALNETTETISDFIKRESKSLNESVGIMKGAKWQAERMYSKKEALQMLEDYDREFKLDTFAYTNACSFTVKEWFKLYENK